MQIQQSIQNIIGAVQTVPPQVLANVVIGQQIEAAVVKAALAAEIASLRIGETIVQVTTPVPLKQGQTVQLELVQTAEKPVLKLIPPSEVPLPAAKPADVGPIKLVPGQQVAVEVIKLLAENRVLVQTTPPSLPSASTVPAKPIQFDIDLSQLTKSFKVGEKAVVEVLTTKPLAIAIKADPVFREQIVIDRIKQLLPQLEAKPQLANLTTALKALSLPSRVQGQIQHLVGHILDKQAITQPQALKQAIASSGVFTERQALRPNPILNTDFKANLLKVAAVIEGELKGKPVQFTSSPLLSKASVLSDFPASTKPVSTTLSTGSLGKSSVAVPTGPITRPNENTTIQNQTNANTSIKPNVEGQIKTAALTSPFAFQNTAKPIESGAVDKANPFLFLCHRRPCR